MDDQSNAGFLCLLVCGILILLHAHAAHKASAYNQCAFEDEFSIVEPSLPWNTVSASVELTPAYTPFSWSAFWYSMGDLMILIGYGFLWMVWATFIITTILSGVEATLGACTVVYLSSVAPFLERWTTSFLLWYWAMGPQTQTACVLASGICIVFTVAYICWPSSL